MIKNSIVLAKFHNHWSKEWKIQKQLQAQYVSFNRASYKKGALPWRKDKLFNKWAVACTCQKLNRDAYLSPFTELKSKWIKDINITAETLHSKIVWLKSVKDKCRWSISEENSVAHKIIPCINKCDHIKLKSFLTFLFPYFMFSVICRSQSS